jgi:hypothetical protein
VPPFALFEFVAFDPGSAIPANNAKSGTCVDGAAPRASPGGFNNCLNLNQRCLFEPSPEHGVRLENNPAQNAVVTVTNGGAEQTLVRLEWSFNGFKYFQERD